MINDKLKGYFGLCRKAGKMSLGHDAVVTSIKKRNAKLVLTCCDTSQRLKNEMKDECSFDNRNIKYIDTDLNTVTMFKAANSFKIFGDDKVKTRTLYGQFDEEDGVSYWATDRASVQKALDELEIPYVGKVKK